MLNHYRGGLIMEDFVKIELAIKLKELGFNIPFFFYYRTDDKKLYHLVRSNPLVYGKDIIDTEVVIAPTIAQVLKWLREEKKLHINVDIDEFGWEYRICKFQKVDNEIYNFDLDYLASYSGEFMSYEEAALAGIEYVLENLI